MYASTDLSAKNFLRRLSHEHTLLESLQRQESAYFDRLEESMDLCANYVDPRQAYIDADGSQWDQVGAGRGGTNRPLQDFAGFANEQELTHARETCRRMKTYSEHVINALENRVNYVIDTGHVYTAVAKKGKKPAAEKVAKLQAFLDTWRKKNKWFDRQCETMERRDLDGEVFRRKFKHEDGYLRVRFVEPWQVMNPPGADLQTTQFGIESEPDDCEEVVAYHVTDLPNGNPVPVPAEEIQHLKANVFSNVRRGVPLFWPCRKNVVRAARIHTNIAAKVEIAAAHCINRKHAPGTTSAQASTFQASTATATRTNPATGVTQSLRQYGPGTTLDTPNGMELEALNFAEGIDEMSIGLKDVLRAMATVCQMPEFMFTSDASNSNFASTMVAEGPAVKSFGKLQQRIKEADMELLDEAIEYAEEKGILEAGTLDEIEVQVGLPEIANRDPVQEAQANEIYARLRILSPQTISGKIDADYEQEQANIEEHEKAGRYLPSDGAAGAMAGGVDENGNPLPPASRKPGEPGDHGDPNKSAKVGALKGKLAEALPEEMLQIVREHLEEFVESKTATGSTCGANGPGGGGFQKNNTCAGGGGGSAKSIPADFAKSSAATAIIDSWATPATGSREGDYAIVRADAEAWVKGEKRRGFATLYKETQAGLKARGIKEATLYRGIALHRDHPLAKAIAAGKIQPGQEFDTEGLTAVSWSDHAGAAEGFASRHRMAAKDLDTYGIVLERVVPAEDVIATHVVHRGFLPGENEWIAQNKGKAKVRLKAVINPVSMKECKDGDCEGAMSFDVSDTDDQRGIEKPDEKKDK